MTAPTRTRLAATAFALNTVWEVAHWPLYECRRSAAVIARAAAVDAAITIGVTEDASVATPGSETGFWPALVTGLGGAALAIEVWALRGGNRLYARRMPRLAGVGVTPLAQLPLLGVAAAKLAGTRVSAGALLRCPEKSLSRSERR